MFKLPSMAATREVQDIPGEERRFVGDGTTALRTPGLKELYGIVHAVVQLPLFDSFVVPMNANASEKKEITMPMVIVVEMDDGCPAIIRSERSNDGVWQKDFDFFVYGLWESDGTPVSGNQS